MYLDIFVNCTWLHIYIYKNYWNPKTRWKICRLANRHEGRNQLINVWRCLSQQGFNGSKQGIKENNGKKGSKELIYRKDADLGFG